MDLGAELRSRGLDVRTDLRAQLFDNYPPTEISVVAVSGRKPTEALLECSRMSPIPAIFLTMDGRGWVLSGGGSGIIAYHALEGQIDPTPQQEEIIIATTELLGSSIVKAPKPSRKKSSVTEEPEAEVVPEIDLSSIEEISGE